MTPVDEDRLDRLRLIRADHVGPVVYRQLLHRYGSAAAAIAALPELARRGGRGAPPFVPARAAVAAEVAAAAALGAVPLFLDDPDYPAALAHVGDAPPVMYVLGDPTLPGRPSVGIVGARNASASGRRFAHALARDLVRAGLVVVSGLARGIDGAAHAGALDAGGGTVAAVAGGLDMVFPPEHAALHARIAEAGAILSESPPGTQPTARLFPRRNRLISGLSLGVVVVEAAERSGSLITARMALEQGREVFAVPGSPLDPRAKGSNGLIRQGAHLTESADDVLAVLAPALQAPRRGAGEPVLPPPATDDADDSAMAQVLELLGPTPVEQDELVRLTGLTASAIATMLLELELAGRLDRHPGHRVSLR